MLHKGPACGGQENVLTSLLLQGVRLADSPAAALWIHCLSSPRPGFLQGIPAGGCQQGHLGRPAPSVRQDTPLDRPLRRGNSPLTWWRLSCPELPSRCFLTSHPPSFLLFSHRFETCTQSDGCRHPYLPLIPPPVSVLYSNPVLELASSGTRTITLLSYHISPLKIFLEKFPFLVYIEISHCFLCPILFSN